MNRQETRGPDQYNFHYKREERLELLGHDPSEGKPGNFFKRNSVKIIIFLDIILIIIIYLVVTLVFKPGEQRGKLAGFHLELKAVAFAEETLVSLIVELPKIKNKAGSLDDEAEIIAVIFSIPEFLEKKQLELLPQEPGTKRIIREKLPFVPGKKVEALVTIGSESRKLSVNPKEEAE